MVNSEKIEFDGNTIVYIRDGEVFTKSLAVNWIAFDLGDRYRLISFFFQIIPVKILDYCYDFVANNRYLISKRVRCVVPSADMRGRILG